MNDAQPMRGMEAVEDLARDRDGLPDGKSAPLAQLFAEGPALEPLEHEIRAPLGRAAEIAHADDVGRRDRGERLSLHAEPICKPVILHELPMK